MSGAKIDFIKIQFELKSTRLAALAAAGRHKTCPYKNNAKRGYYRNGRLRSRKNFNQ